MLSQKRKLMSAQEESSTFAPKTNERLDKVIKKLKDNVNLVHYKDSSDDEEIPEEVQRKVVILNASRNGGPAGNANAVQVIPSGDSSLTKSYIMWENSANVCWLDASMALLVHNRTLTRLVNESTSAQIAVIIQYYYEAISILNDYSDERHIDVRIKAARDLLQAVQESALKYLQPILKYKEGEPDSAFCSLFNLITEDKSIKDFFNLEFTWVQVCEKCNTRRVKNHKKPIITLPRAKAFHPSSPTSIYQCPVCKQPDQMMTLHFRTLPQCLLFHFENGAGKGELQCDSFEVDARTYRMTGVMTLEKGNDSLVNHFVTFIRDPPSDTWLECNDLQEDTMYFSVVPPFIDGNDVYIIMYEAADEAGTIPNYDVDLDEHDFGEESVSGVEDIPLIDIADEADKDAAGEVGSKRSRDPKGGSNNFEDVGLFSKACEDEFKEDFSLVTQDKEECKDLADSQTATSSFEKESGLDVSGIKDEEKISLSKTNPKEQPCVGVALSSHTDTEEQPCEGNASSPHTETEEQPCEGNALSPHTETEEQPCEGNAPSPHTDTEEQPCEGNAPSPHTDTEEQPCVGEALSPHTETEEQPLEGNALSPYTETLEIIWDQSMRTNVPTDDSTRELSYVESTFFSQCECDDDSDEDSDDDRDEDSHDDRDDTNEDRMVDIVVNRIFVSLAEEYEIE